MGVYISFVESMEVVGVVARVEEEGYLAHVEEVKMESLYVGEEVEIEVANLMAVVEYMPIAAVVSAVLAAAIVAYIEWVLVLNLALLDVFVLAGFALAVYVKEEAVLLLVGTA